MAIDRILGRPIRALYPFAVFIVPVAFLLSVLAMLVARQYAAMILTVYLVAMISVVVRFTPYLLMACGCFFAMSQLVFPKSLDPRAWGFHGLWISLAAFCMWRAWRLWPPDLPKMRQFPRSTEKTPLWKAVVGTALGIFGILAIIAMFAYMAYVFDFQE